MREEGDPPTPVPLKRDLAFKKMKNNNKLQTFFCLFKNSAPSEECLTHPLILQIEFNLFVIKIHERNVLLSHSVLLGFLTH